MKNSRKVDLLYTAQGEINGGRKPKEIKSILELDGFELDPKMAINKWEQEFEAFLNGAYNKSI